MRSDHGFSIVEVLVATTVVAIGICGVAQLFVLALAANVQANDTTRATVLARDKIEQLRAKSVDELRSPPGALSRDTPGFFDVVDGTYLRRWSVETLASSPDTIVYQVVVVHIRHRKTAGAAGRPRGPGEVRLLTVKTRKAP